MNDNVRLSRDPRPIGVAHPQVRALEVSHNRLNAPLLDPVLVPHTPTLPTLPQPRQSRLGRLRAHMAVDLPNARRPREQVAEDKRPKESRPAGKEHRLESLRRLGLLVRHAQALREDLRVVRVLGIDGNGCGVRDVRRVTRETEVRGAEAVECGGEGADGREVKDDAERRADGEGLAEVEDEAGREDRVAAEVEEAFVERDLAGRGGEELDPDVVDRALGRRERLGVGGGVGRRGGGDGVGEGEGGLVDLAVRVERHASEGDEDCGIEMLAPSQRTSSSAESGGTNQSGCCNSGASS